MVLGLLDPCSLLSSEGSPTIYRRLNILRKVVKARVKFWAEPTLKVWVLYWITTKIKVIACQRWWRFIECPKTCRLLRLNVFGSLEYWLTKAIKSSLLLETLKSHGWLFLECIESLLKAKGVLILGFMYIKTDGFIIESLRRLKTRWFLKRIKPLRFFETRWFLKGIESRRFFETLNGLKTRRFVKGGNLLKPRWLLKSKPRGLIKNTYDRHQTRKLLDLLIVFLT